MHFTELLVFASITGVRKEQIITKEVTDNCNMILQLFTRTSNFRAAKYYKYNFINLAYFSLALIG